MFDGKLLYLHRQIIRAAEEAANIGGYFYASNFKE